MRTSTSKRIPCLVSHFNMKTSVRRYIVCFDCKDNSMLMRKCKQNKTILNVLWMRVRCMAYVFAYFIKAQGLLQLLHDDLRRLR